MEYVPETIHNVVVSNHSQSGEIPLIYVKVCTIIHYIIVFLDFINNLFIALHLSTL